MNIKDIYDLYDNEFIKYTEDQCYLFIYDHLHLNFLAKLLNRDLITFLYQSAKMPAYELIFNKIFCQNGKNSVRASITEGYLLYDDTYPSVYGIVIKITKNELEILKIYYINYELLTCLISPTSTRILFEDYIDTDGELMARVEDHLAIYPYIFIYEDDNENNIRETPTKSYIKKINKMLHNREQINEHKKQYYEKFLKK